MLRRYFLVRRIKFLIWNNRWRALRQFLLACQGFEMGKGAQIGKISSTWPHNVSIGNHSLAGNGVALNYSGPYTLQKKIKIGDHVHISNDTEFNIHSGIEVQDNVMIGSGCKFIDHDHGFELLSVPLRSQPINASPILISSNSWIGSNCIILKGVTIGTGSIVGAGSIVVKSIPPYELWAGNPARFIRPRA